MDLLKLNEIEDFVSLEILEKQNKKLVEQFL